MFDFKNSFAAFASVCLLVCSLATLLSPTRGQVNKGGGPPQVGPRRFYLTNTFYFGSQALTACAEGYHMASLWEIHDTSNLSYNTELGFASQDSGSGPPSGAVGWIRTGNGSAGDSAPVGIANCGGLNAQPWTSASGSDQGTVACPDSIWDSGNPVSVISPWVAFRVPCTQPFIRVWCVQD